MKTSHILFLTTLSLFIAFTLGINWVLKGEFDKIDKTDPYVGFSSHPLKPFKYVKLHGMGFGLTEIRTDKAPELKMIIEPKYIDWKVANDTLTIFYKPDWKRNNMVIGGDYESRPSIYVFTPELAGITSDQIRTRVMRAKTPHLDIHQNGDGMLIMRSEIPEIRADVTSNGYLRLHGSNSPMNADIQVADSSSFLSDKDIFKRLNASIDSTAHLNVPGSVVKKLK
ncbi:GIN domain-containing protein [Dyadobacter jiangsuensis]